MSACTNLPIPPRPMTEEEYRAHMAVIDETRRIGTAVVPDRTTK
jgi:hypothetical protein